MDKIIAYFNEHNDICINFLKTRPIVCTLDFDNKHIQKVKPLKKEQGKLQVFSWTEYKFRNVDLLAIKSLYPLSKMLNNV